MSDLNQPGASAESDYGGLFVVLLVRWLKRWKWIAGIVGFFTILAGTVAILSKKSYTAYQVVQIKGQKSSASALLSSLGAGSMASLIGAGENGNYYAILSLAQSRELAKSMIRNFRLDTVWELKQDWKAEDGRKRWSSHFDISPDEFNPDAIRLSFRDSDPARAAVVVSLVTHWLDSVFLVQEMAQSNRNYEFIRKRVSRKYQQLDSAEADLLKYVRKEKMAAPDERIIMSATKMAELEMQKEKLDIEGEMAVRMKGPQSSERALIEQQKKMIQAQIQELDENGPTSWAGSPVGMDVQRRFLYERKVKAVEQHATVLKYLVQQEEMLQIDAQKDVPVLMIVDPVEVPQKKSAPKVMLIVQLVFAVSLTFSLLVVALEKELRWVFALIFREVLGKK